MKAQFSFEESSLTMEQESIDSRDIPSNYSSKHMQNTTWTNLRVQQIKRKYDTPNSQSKKSILSNYSQQSILNNQNKLPLQQKSNNYLNSPLNSQLVSQKKYYHHLQNIQPDETLFFQKIQKMKESIKEKKKIPKILTEKDKIYYNIKDITNRESIDPRIKNIDKINNKIKHILQCLHENQVENTFSKKNSIISQKTHFNQKTNTQYVQCYEKIEQEKLKNDSNKQILQTIINDKKIDHNKTNPKQLNIRSKSCLEGYTFSKQNIFPQNNQFMKNKKVNQEIQRIQKRIKKFQDQKKRLNIQFEPNKKHNRSTTKLSKQQSHKTTICQDLAKIKTVQEKQQVQNFQFQLKVSNSSISIHNNNYSKFNPQQSNKLKYNYVKLKVSQQNQKSQNKKHVRNNQELKIKTKQGIQNRRKKLQLGDQVSQKSEQVQRLIKSFVKQVELDQYLRNSKIWLDNCTIDKKYQKIHQQLMKQNLQLNYNETLSQFSITQQENNPFYTLRQNASTIQNTVQVYLKAKKHWQQNIIHQFNQQKLKRINFINEKLDMQRKGYLCINDIVRFLNMEGGKFFRTRDVVLIWRRITIDETIKNGCFYKIICSITK